MVGSLMNSIKFDHVKKSIDMTKYILFLLCFPFSLLAQNLNITGKVVDETNNQALPGAHISLLYPWDEVVKATVTDATGHFEFDNAEKGGYKLKISFLGYVDKEQEVTLTNQSIALGVIKVAEGAVNLNTVEVKEKLPLAQQNRDTTAYNANAFKTLKDASAEDLIEKIPGVIKNGGQLQVEGENVGKVLVDGREFFGNDPNAALKNLPAEIISKIQVFDQQSDQSQFTGFDDGNTTKTINIITKNGTSNAQFGKLYTGYGTDNRYQGGGNTSFFDGDRRISIIGQSNNINIQNFAAEDLLGVVGGGSRRGGRSGRGGGGRGGRRGGRGGGISTSDFLVPQAGGVASTNAFGINYSDKFGKKFKLSGSYFFNNTDNTSIENSLIEFVDNETVSEFYQEDNISSSDNFNHRINGVLEYDFSERTSLIMRPRITWQLNVGNSNTIAKTLSGENLLNSTITDFNSDLNAISGSNSLLIRHRFEARGRTLSLGISNTYTNNEGQSFLNSQNEIRRQMILSDTLNQLANLDINGWRHSANLSYTEPIGKGMAMFNYRASVQEDDSDKRTFDFNEGNQEYTAFNEPLSSVFNNQNWTHQLGTGYSYRKNRAFFAMARVNAQWSYLNTAETFPAMVDIKRNYFNLVPFAMIRAEFSKQENLRFMYRTNTQTPTVKQLQNVVDNSNPLQLTTGNPDLDQSFNHRLFLRYTKTNLEKASVFFFMISGSFTDNYIGNSTYLADRDNPIFAELNVQRGTQLSRPVNLDGYRNFRIFTTYGFPFKVIKTNINLDLSANLTEIPGLINEELNTSQNRSLTGGITFASNISENVDFTISSRSSLNSVENSLQRAGNTNYLSQNTSLKLGWVLPGGIVYRTSIAHQFYDGLADNFDSDYFLWNMSLGKKMLKEDRGELAITIFDLLNQNQSIVRNVTDVYIEDLRTNVLQQYFMLKFTWNFRNFNSGKTKSTKEPDEDRRRNWRGRF